MKKHTDKIRSRPFKADEPLITMQQLNAAVRQLPHLRDMFIEELMKRVSHEDFTDMEPNLPALGNVFTRSIGECYYNHECANPHPETFSELRARFTDGEERIIDYLHAAGAEPDAGAEIALKATYKHMCHRLESSMTVQSIGEQPRQYLLQ